MLIGTTLHEPEGTVRAQSTAEAAKGRNRLRICRTVAEVRSAIAELRAAGESVALVPTMGALHAGHMELVAAARRAPDRVVASIFVNPTQFGGPKDLELYPRTEAQDLEALETGGSTSPSSRPPPKSVPSAARPSLRRRGWPTSCTARFARATSAALRRL